MYDSIVIGAGPAGLSAARILQHSQKVLVIDEYFYPGGRLLGQLYEEEKNSWWNGLEMADELHENTKEKTEIKLNTSVYNIEFNGTYTVYTTHGNFESDHLVIATGAREKSTPLPGWDLPGVMTVGAAQVLTNFSRVKPGDKGVIVGVNPLSMVIALELGYADIEVAKICLPQENLINSDTPREALKTLMSLGRSAPSKPLSLAAGIADKAMPFHSTAVKLFPKNGVKVMGMPISIKEKIIRINGVEKVESVTTQKTDAAGTLIADTDRVIDCDFVCLSDGLAPLNEMASLLDLKHIYSEALGGYVPLHSEKMQTELPNLYVAGNITGIENAKIAIFQGEMAAHQILNNEELSLNTLTKINNERKHAKVKFHQELHHGKEMVQKFWRKWETRSSQ